MDAYLLWGLVFLLAGTIKGTFGIGLPTVSVALLSQFILPHTAVTLVVFPILVSNFWQMYRMKAGLGTLRRYQTLVAVMVVSLFLTTFVTAQVSTDVLLGVIGMAVVIFAATSLARTPPVLPDQFDRSGQAAAGMAAGVLGGLTSIWAPPVVTYLIARRVDRDEFVRASGLLLAIGGIPLVLGFWNAGLLTAELAQLSAWMVIPTLIGFSVGEVIRRRMATDIFRTALLWMFLLLGLNLLRLTVFGA